MSALRDINTINLIQRHRTRIFFETGTGLGDGIQRMKQPEYGFDLLISCDIDKELADHAAKTFRQEPARIRIYNAEGPTVLRDILPQLPLDQPIFYWLDSHFANSDYNLGDKPLVSHEASGLPDVRLPAWNEIKIIKELRIDKGARDLILLDDIMLYDEREDYEDSVARLSGNQPVPPQYRTILKRSIELLKDTHKAVRHVIAQGILVLEPR
jgi:hypothetical protein